MTFIQSWVMSFFFPSLNRAIGWIVFHTNSVVLSDSMRLESDIVPQLSRPIRRKPDGREGSPSQ